VENRVVFVIRRAVLMAKSSRLKSGRLPEKLRQIRLALGLSQNEMISRLGFIGELIREELSAFERGIRQPPLGVLLEYARVAGVYVDVLIDDELDLPESIPGVPKHKGAKRKPAAKSKNKQ
jgi:transcriptional regulator with XRE-family HTH domain